MDGCSCMDVYARVATEQCIMPPGLHPRGVWSITHLHDPFPAPAFPSGIPALAPLVPEVPFGPGSLL